MPDTESSPPPGSSRWERHANGATSADDPCGPHRRADAPKSGPDAFKEALGRFAEAREYATHLAAVEFDRLKLKIRRVLMWVAAGIAALVIALAILASAAFLLLAGIAEAIGNLAGHLWIGNLIVGGGILLMTAGGVWIGLNWWQTSTFAALRERYGAQTPRARPVWTQRRSDRGRLTFPICPRFRSSAQLNASPPAWSRSTIFHFKLAPKNLSPLSVLRARAKQHCCARLPAWND